MLIYYLFFMVNRYSQRYNFSKINDIMLNVKVFIKLNLKIGILHQMPEKRHKRNFIRQKRRNSF